MFLHKNQLAVATEIKKVFHFNNESKSIHSLLSEIVSFIKIHLPSDSYEDKISSCKQILIELLTNGIKHSDTASSVITIVLADNQVSISKSDSGRMFYLDNYTGWPPLQWPLEKKYLGEKIRIYSDDINQLYAVIESDQRISFELIEYPIGTLTNDTNLMEHYGLLILRKLSDEFFYAYDPSAGSNLFRATIKLV